MRCAGLPPGTLDLEFVFGMGFALLASAVGNGGTCTSTDTPLQWTIETNYVDGTLNSVLSDNGTPYVDGQSGVTARINICSGTNDATLNLKTRYYTVNFLKHLTRIERDVVARGVSLPWPSALQTDEAIAPTPGTRNVPGGPVPIPSAASSLNQSPGQTTSSATGD